MKRFNELIEAKGGLRIPTGASNGLVATSDANGNIVWATGGAPSGTAGGDLSGTFPNPTVAKLNGVAAASYVQTSDSRLTDVRNLNYQASTHTARLAATATLGKVWKETDTGLIYIGNGSTWDIFKAQGHVIKTSLETVNNSAVLQNDDHLFFPIEVNETWLVEGFLMVTSASTTSDFQAAWTFPTGLTGLWRYVGTGTWAEAATASTPTTLVAPNTAVTWGSANGTWGAIFDGIFTADATHAGTVQLQWAQNTQTAEDTTVKGGSLLRLTRLA